MPPKTRNAAGSGTGGAREDRLCWTLDGSLHTRNRRALQLSAETDELLIRLRDRFGRPGLTDFEAGFIKSIFRQAKRGGSHWRPTARQLGVIREIVSRPTEPADDMLLIEDEGGDDPIF